jgi:hypothetical protein
MGERKLDAVVELPPQPLVIAPYRRKVQRPSKSQVLVVSDHDTLGVNAVGPQLVDDSATLLKADRRKRIPPIGRRHEPQ